MPKTKDAFALRDFDAQRIWERKFFGGTEVDYDFPDNNFWQLPLEDDSDMYYELKGTWECPHNVKDEEIIGAYCIQAIESQKDYDYFRVQRIVDVLKRISNYVTAYLKKIRRHSKRLEKYLEKWSEQICFNETYSATEIRTRMRRIHSLLNSYANVQNSINDLQRTIKRYVTEIVENDEKNDRNIFAMRLRQARMAAGYTQTQLANKIGITQGGYTNYENSRCEPSVSMIKRLARILNRPTDWLLGLTP